MKSREISRDYEIRDRHIALSSLILVRFPPFFHQNAQNLKGKNVGPQIYEMSRELARIQDHNRHIALYSLILF